MFWFEDPALQAAIDHQRANPTDWVPRPVDVEFGFLAWLLSQSQGPWPKVGDDPAAHYLRCRIAALINQIPGLSDLEAYANARLRKPLGDAMADIRGELAARLGCRFEGVDRLMVRDAAAVLLHEPAPGPAEAPSEVEPAGPPGRKPPRGSLDEHAVIELKKNPALTFEQLATILGCNATTLRDRKKCPLLAQAKAMIRAERDTFRGAPTWRDRQPDDDEA